MRAAIDEQIFLLQRMGGVSRYFAELIVRLPGTEPPVDVVTPFRSVVNRHLLEAAQDGRFQGARGPLQPYPLLAAAAARPRRRITVDLVHHTFYHPRFLRDYPGVPKAVTVYDMIPEVMGTRGRFGNPHMAKREYVKRADLLFFISQSAYEDLSSMWGEPSAPHVVTHLGVDERFFDGGERPAGAPRDYVLYVGNRGGYKDFTTLLSAFAEAGPEFDGTHLVCIGGGPLSAAERDAAAQVGLRGRIHQYSLSDAQMPGAYANAAAFVFPSRYEGFGLPALEAMAAGTPALLADVSSLPEVGGDAALYFAPGEGAELAGQLLRLLSDQALRADLVRRGRERARQFTWARTAQQTADAYRTVVG